MPFMDEKFCAIRWHPPTTLPKKNTHLMLYKPFRRIPYLKDGLIYQRLRERTTLKRTPNLQNKGLLQRQRMLNQQWVLMAFFVLSASSSFFFFFFSLVCPSPDSSIILREKKQMADAQTQIMDPVMNTLGM